MGLRMATSTAINNPCCRCVFSVGTDVLRVEERVFWCCLVHGRVRGWDPTAWLRIQGK